MFIRKSCFKRSFRRERVCCSLVGIAVIATALPAFAQSKPYAFTQSAGPVRSHTATLHGMVTPNGLPTTTWFEWGIATSLDYTTTAVEVGSGSAVVGAEAAITNDLPTCYYRVAASNALGVVYGQQQLFTRSARLLLWGQTFSFRPNVSGFNARAIAVGDAFGLALNSQGEILSWGDSTWHQGNVPKDIPPVRDIAAGTSHSLALTTDGEVVGWGRNDFGQTSVPADLSNVVSIAAGEFHSAASGSNGEVVVWGRNSYGQTNVPPGLSNVVAIAVGGSHVMALKHDGSVVAWGYDAYGQTNVPTELSNVIAIAAGQNHSLALKNDGTVVAWGQNNRGQTNVPSTFSNVVAIAAGSYHSFALRSDETAAGWGFDNAGQATIPTDAGRILALEGGNYFSAMLRIPEARPFAHTRIPTPITATAATLNGVVTPNGLPTVAWFEWGQDSIFDHATVPTDAGDRADLVHLKVSLNGLAANAVYRCRLVASNSAGGTHGMVQQFTTGMRPVAWGAYVMGTHDFIIPPPGLSNVVSLVAGDYHGLALSADGSLAIWGSWGIFGSVTQALYVPASLTNVVGIAGGRDHDVALLADGTVVAWGADADGQTNVPAGLTNVVAVSAGDEHTMALKSDGTVVVWGRFGLGNGAPAEVPAGLNNVVAISSGDTQCMALRDDGSVFLWSGPTFDSVPVSLTNVVAIESDYQHNVVLSADGTVSDWGPAAASVPPGLTNVLSIASGDFADMALTMDGDLNVWPSQYANLPTGLTGVVAIASGDTLKMALAANTPPQQVPGTFTGPGDQDWVINLANDRGSLPLDPNGDLLTCRITELPTSGTLYQYLKSGRGNAITEANTLVTDPLNRVIFVPTPGEYGVPYTSFSVVANDGELDSSPSLLTVNVVPRPPLEFAGFDASEHPMLSFGGLSNVTYSVYASTNLVNWLKLGTATQTDPGVFIYTDASAGALPFRFYRIESP